MNELQKRIAYWVIVVFVVILGVYLLVSIDQKANTATTTNTVSFSGEGKVLAKPDIAMISLSITTEAATSKAAQDQNSVKSQKVVDYLKSQGIDEKDIKTTGYNIYPQYDYETCYSSSVPCRSSTKIKGYQVNDSLQIKIRDLNKASDVLDGVVKAGANQVNQLSFQIENPEALKEQAREKAIADAKAKAGNLKNQLGIRLGRIINFVEGYNGYPVPMYDSSYKAESMGMGGATPAVPSGENEITVNVTITYQIK